jgi:shikimate kinase/3-dehydroquinate synthase
MLATLRLSGQDALRDEVEELLERVGLPTKLDPAIPVDAVIEACGRDKKRTAEGIGFVLVDGPGRVAHGRSVGADSLRAAVSELTESAGR